MPPPRYVLDSFALLAHLRDEPGRQRVTELLRDASKGQNELFMCLINLGEVHYLTSRRFGSGRAIEVTQGVLNLPIAFVEVDLSLTLAAAEVKASHAMSYADAFAVALAQDRHATLITGDPELEQISHLVDIEWLPQRP